MEEMPSLRERQAEQVRQELRSQFVHLVVERGPHGFTFDDVARAAGVSRRTLYRYFPNREAIMQSLRESEMKALDQELLSRAGSMTAFRSDPDLVAETFAVLDRHAELVRAGRLLGVTGFDGRTSEDRTRLVKQMIAQTRGVHPSVADQLAGLVRLLLGSETWARLRDPDIDLDPREAGYAVHWAVQVLIRAAIGVEGPLRPVAEEPDELVGLPDPPT